MLEDLKNLYKNLTQEDKDAVKEALLQSVQFCEQEEEEMVCENH